MAIQTLICQIRRVTIRSVSLIPVGFVICMFYFFSLYQYPVQLSQQVWLFEEGNRHAINDKLILLWSNISYAHHYTYGLRNQPFLNCPTSNCKTTTNRSLLNQSDAIIFHMNKINFGGLPKHRLPHQRWILFMMESPPHTPIIINRLNNIFNWTMTYRVDSDVPCPYSIHDDEIDERMLAESKEREAGDFDRKLTDLLSKKNKTVAWVVSNCDPSSGRRQYVDILKKYINVSIYGKCNKNVCLGKTCFKTLGQQYKFYLSFENSLCRDYVTEKFYHPLLNNMVPIVYGSANYSTIPELHSAYIDVKDFNSVQDLANYLHYLDKNDEAYQKYFKWRRKPAGLSVLPRIQTVWCNLCQKLSQIPPKPFITYSDMSTWWVDQAKCGEDKKIFDLQMEAISV